MEFIRSVGKDPQACLVLGESEELQRQVAFPYLGKDIDIHIYHDLYLYINSMYSMVYILI